MVVSSVSYTPKNSPGRVWQSPKIEKACGLLPSVNPRWYTFCKLESMDAGITGQFFQSAGSSAVAIGVGVSVDVTNEVADGDTETRTVGMTDAVTVGWMMAGGVKVGVGEISAVEFAPQADNTKLVKTIKNDTRFIL